MDRQKFLLSWSRTLVALVVVGMVFGPAPSQASSAGCSPALASAGFCSGAQASTSGVDVWANQTFPRASGGGGNSGGSAGGNSGPLFGAPGEQSIAERYPAIPMSNEYLLRYCLILVTRPAICDPPATAGTAPVAEPTYVAPTIVVSDVASFAPEQPWLVTEPDGWGVAGLESNMVTQTRTHVVPGTLLGAPAEVRFTPVSYDWSYGDGATRSSSTPGATWATQVLPEFSVTSTSHAYSQTGTYSPSVRVWFALEYRWGGSVWIPIEGAVFRDAPASVVLIVEATNVLVQGPCQPGSTAPGC